jgi:hypothetical protein
MYSRMLKWRKANNVDATRQDIIYGGRDSPLKFPNGKKIIQLAPQIIISANACDKQNYSLALEMYGFSPKEILQNVTKEEYLIFFDLCFGVPYDCDGTSVSRARTGVDIVQPELRPIG